MSKWLFIFLLFILVSIFFVLFVVTRVENHQANKNNERLIDRAINQATESKVAVIVFSRSGNTGKLAEHIATKENADVYEITAEDYKLGIPGLINALKDARTNIAKISPSTIDLSEYSKVYLGSPIWLYSPAPPIWQFASENNFKDKEVVLFNSFNSKFEQHFIDSFDNLVKAQGAKSFTHQFIKRGRMGSQISTKKMLEQFDAKYQSNN